MPANRTNIAVAGTLKVNGSNSAIVRAGPMPGKTPMSVPTRQPTKPYNKVIGCSATAKPCISDSNDPINTLKKVT